MNYRDFALALMLCSYALAQQPPASTPQQSPAPAPQQGGAQSSPADKPPSSDSADTTKVYKLGHGVSAPVALETPQPGYEEKAKHARYQGAVLLWIVIDSEGNVGKVKVARSLQPDLDRKAVEAVRKWRFKPAMKDGKPVAVQVNVEVNFHLY